MAFNIEDLLTEVESASASEDIRVLENKIRILMDVGRFNMEKERIEMDVGRFNMEKERIEMERERRESDSYRKKFDGIRSLIDLERSKKEGGVSSEIEKYKKIIKYESGIDKGSMENVLYLHSEITGGDGKKPIGIINNGIDSLSVTASIRTSPDPTANIVALFNGEWRIKIRDDKDSIYDIINVEFVNGQTSFNYSTDNKPADCHVSEDDFVGIEFNNTIYTVVMVNPIHFVIYKYINKLN